MTLSEFKAWLEGYSEAFADGVPNADQWAKVQAKLADVKMVASSVTINDRPYPVKPNQWFDQRFTDVRGKEFPTFADPVVSPLLKPQITC